MTRAAYRIGTLCGLLFSLAMAQGSAPFESSPLEMAACEPFLLDGGLGLFETGPLTSFYTGPGGEICEDNSWSFRSKAKGRPNSGSLEYGRQLASSKYVLPNTADRYGTQELVDLIEFVGHEMYPTTGKALVVNDLSQRKGGFLSPHRSHQNGLDVDIGNFYALGKEYDNKRWQLLDRNDDNVLATNWRFIVTMQQGPAKVTDIYWNYGNIAAMRKYVERTEGADAWRQYGAVLRGRSDHKTHYHVRIAANSFPNSKKLVGTNENLSRSHPYSL